MMALDPQVFAGFMVLIVGILWNVLDVLWKGWLLGMTRMTALAKRVACWWIHRPKDDNDDCEVRKQINKLLSVRRLQSAKAANLALRFCLAVYGCMLVSFVGADSVLHALRPWVIGISLIVTTGVSMAPVDVFTDRTVALLHSLCMLALALLLVMEDPDSKMRLSYAWEALLTIPIGCLCLRFRMVVVTNVCLSASMLLGILLDDDVGHDRNYLRRSVLAEALSLMLRLAIFHIAETLLDISVRREVAAQVGKCQQSAVSSLLDLMCDAVLDLDKDLRLKEHFSKFAHVLMHRSGRCLKGVHFSDFLGDSDRASFRESMLKSQQGDDSAASMLTVRLRDSMGTHVRVVLYHVPYRSVGGNINHIIGFREEIDLCAGTPSADGSLGPPMSRGRGMPEAVLPSDIADRFGVAVGSADGGLGLGSGVRSRSSSRIMRSARSSARNGNLNIGTSGFGCCRRMGWEEPHADFAVELAVAKGLPVGTMGTGLRAALGLGEDEECNLGEFLPDNGTWLFSAISTEISDAREVNRGTAFVEDIAEITLTSTRSGAQEPFRGMAFLFCNWPLSGANGALRPVFIGFSRQRLGGQSAGGGAAASSSSPDPTAVNPPRVSL